MQHLDRQSFPDSSLDLKRAIIMAHSSNESNGFPAETVERGAEIEKSFFSLFSC